MRQLGLGMAAALVWLGLNGCGGDTASDPAADTAADAPSAPARSAAEAPAEAPAEPQPEPEKPWLLGLRWRGTPEERVELEVEYHLGEQLGTQDQRNRPQVRSEWSYMIGSPWVKGMTVQGEMDEGTGPVTVELIRARLTSDSPIIDSDDDVELGEVLATMTVEAGAPASMQGGELLDDA